MADELEAASDGDASLGDGLKLSVIVPFLNERDTLRPALERLEKADLPLPVELLLVDDGSTDGSVETISDWLEVDRDVTLIRHARSRGKGAAVRAGIARASGQIITVFDGDLEYDPNDFVELLQPILEGEADIVYGTRSFTSSTAYSFWYVIGNRLIAFWCSFLFNTWISDVETCFKVARAEVWKGVRLRSKGFGIEAEITGRFLRTGRRIYEIPISYAARSREEGKKLHWTDGVAALWILLRTRLSPRSPFLSTEP